MKVKLTTLLYYFYNKHFMQELSSMKAATDIKIKQEDAWASKYGIIKVLLSGDILAKDEQRQLYLLCHTSHKRVEPLCFTLEETNIVQAIEVIEEQGNNYEVYPFEKKLRWAGDVTNFEGKSEIYCVTLLYSAIRHIIKPMKNCTALHNPQKYIILENVWIRENSVFLFLRNKGKDHNLNRTETISDKKVSIWERSLSPRDELIETAIIKRMGEVFWMMFYQGETLQYDSNKQTFRQILKSMIKGDLKYSELQKIMEDKTARKKFINNRRNVIDPKETINYSSIEASEPRLLENPINIKLQTPIYNGTAQRGLLFHNEKRPRPREVFQKSTRVGLGALLDPQDNIVPPSFSHGKRFKRRSIFSDVRSFSRGNESLQKEKKSYKKVQRYSLTPNENKTLQNFSFGLPKSSNSKVSDRYFINPSVGRKKKISMPMDDLKIETNFETLQRRSEEKALLKVRQLRQSIDTNKDTNQTIDDKKFRSQIRQARVEYKKTVNASIMKAHQYLEHRYKSGYAQSQYQASYTHQLDKIANMDMIVDNKPIQKKELCIEEEFFVEKTQHRENKNEKPSGEGSLTSQKKQSTKLELPKKQAPIVKQTKQQLIKRQTPSVEIPARKVSFKIEETYKEPLVVPTPKVNSSASAISAKEQQKKMPEEKKEVITQIQQNRVDLNKLSSVGSIESHGMANLRQDSTVELIPLSKETLKFEQFSKRQIFEEKSDELKPTSLDMIAQSKEKEAEKKKTEVNQQVGNKKPLLDIKKLENIYSKVEQNVFEQVQSPKDYVYISKIDAKKPSSAVETVKEISKPPSPVKKQKAILKPPQNLSQIHDDEIEEVNFEMKKQVEIKKKPASSTIIPNQPQAKKEMPKSTLDTNKQLPLQNNQPELKKKPQSALPASAVETKQQIPKQAPGNGRLKTNQSNASSNGAKPVRKQIDQYIHMINKMGEAVAKTAKLSKKLDNKLQWYTGVYFLYKRFFYQRKKIEKFLEESIPRLTRYDPFNDQDWKEWLLKGERQQLLTKCKDDNLNIQNSIKKMSKKMEVKQLPGRVLTNVGLNKNIAESTKIAVEYVVDEYDQAVQQNLQHDPEISTHLCEMINALYVIAQIDKKVEDKRPVLDFSNIKRSADELSKMVQTIFDLYQQ